MEQLILKLKLQYFGRLMRRTDSLEKTLMLGKTEGRRRESQRINIVCTFEMSVVFAVLNTVFHAISKVQLLEPKIFMF